MDRDGLPRPILPRSDLLQIENARDRVNAVVKPPGDGDGSGFDLSQCRVGGSGQCTQDCHPAVVRRHQPLDEQSGREELMSAAEQAFLLTGELFVLSFVAIYAFWFADKLRRSLLGGP
jgi:hypothetical protein